MKESELHAWLKKLEKGDQRAFHMIYEELNEQIYRTVGCSGADFCLKIKKSTKKSIF